MRTFALEASRPRSAAPSKSSPSPPPRRANLPCRETSLRFFQVLILRKSATLGTGGAQRMLAHRMCAQMRIGCILITTLRRAPTAPSLRFFRGGPRPGGIAMRAETCTPGRRRARGDFRRCRGARAASPHIEVSPRNRPSEHSGENHTELADDPHEDSELDGGSS